MNLRIQYLKSFLIVFAAAVFLGAGLAARPVTAGDVFNQLLVRHHQEMQKLMTTRTMSPFFLDVSFNNEAQVKRLLHSVSHGKSGYMQMSYTSYSNFNGDRRLVNVSILRNGDQVKLMRTTNDNGQLLKAVYDFNASTGELKTDAFANQERVQSVKYSI